jgi:hypothetical protein
MPALLQTGEDRGNGLDGLAKAHFIGQDGTEVSGHSLSRDAVKEKLNSQSLMGAQFVTNDGIYHNGHDRATIHISLIISAEEDDSSLTVMVVESTEFLQATVHTAPATAPSRKRHHKACFALSRPLPQDRCVKAAKGHSCNDNGFGSDGGFLGLPHLISLPLFMLGLQKERATPEGVFCECSDHQNAFHANFESAARLAHLHIRLLKLVTRLRSISVLSSRSIIHHHLVLDRVDDDNSSRLMAGCAFREHLKVQLFENRTGR